MQSLSLVHARESVIELINGEDVLRFCRTAEASFAVPGREIPDAKMSRANKPAISARLSAALSPIATSNAASPRPN
jgi:hypothetical protein